MTYTSRQSYATTNGSSTSGMTSDHNTRMCGTTDPHSLTHIKFLPITLRGSFFQDDIFLEAHRDFDNAVRRVLETFNIRSLLKDDLTTYRSLRQADIREETQAIAVSENQHSHKVVLDVKDFLGGELTVKAMSDNELLVEGTKQKKEGTGCSSGSFSRRFVVCDPFDPKNVTSALSSDGILTITAQKNGGDRLMEASIPIAIKSSVNGTSQSFIKLQNNNKTMEDNKYDISLNNQVTNKQLQNESSKYEEAGSPKRESFSSNSTEKFAKENCSHKASKSNVLHSAKGPNVTGCELLIPELRLQISRRGLFSEDNFFTDARHHFDDAVSEVVERWNNQLNTVSPADEFSRYRRLRQLDISHENQAMKAVDEHDSHKIVLDVTDYCYEDLVVKVVGPKELLVEGRSEKKDEKLSSTRSFSRRFLLPEEFDIATLTSTLSSDGVLTITAPKKNLGHQVDAKNIPIDSIEDEISFKNFIRTNKVKSGTKEHVSTTSDSSDKHKSVDIITSQLDASNKQSTNVTQESILLKENNNQHVNSNSSDMVSSEGDNFTNCLNEKHILSSRKSVNKSHDDFKVKNGSHISEYLLPISQRGLFFDDAFFKDTHYHFDKAIQEILSRRSSQFSSAGGLETYRQLRESSLCEANQAVKFIEEASNIKMVLDVQDFLGNVKVKVVEAREVVVEGSMARRKGATVATKTFRRCFTLPAGVDPEDITSAISADGVLTITAPKTQSTYTRACEKTMLNTTQGCDKTSSESQESVESAETDIAKDLGCRKQTFEKTFKSQPMSAFCL